MDNNTKISLAVLLIILAAFSGYLYINYLKPDAEYSYGDVNVDKAKTLIEEKPNLVILDVRTESEFHESHIEGAINIPVGELEQRLSEIKPEDEYLVYCRTGNRSTNAIKILKDHGYHKIYHLESGITAWTSAGFPTVK